ncbi:MAG: hypothetical protein U5J95_03500 [Balneolaceae bacterium]|nr:hypothetical protein [Balneolaceae bacterium]
MPRQKGFIDLSDIIDIEIADINSDGQFELITWSSEGIQVIGYDTQKASWVKNELISTELGAGKKAGLASLFVVDLV